MNHYFIYHYKKNRSHLEAFGNEPIDFYLFKPKFKNDDTLNVNKIIDKLSEINISYNKVKEDYKFDIFYTYLIAKIFTKFNYIYEKYLEAKKTKNYKKKV